VKEFKLTRSNRRSLALHIRDGCVEIRAPFGLPEHRIQAFIAKKEKWIEVKLAESISRVKRRESFSLSYGDDIRYRGALYRITEMYGDKRGFIDTCFYIPPDLSPGEIKNYCTDVLKMQAGGLFPYVARRYIGLMAVSPAGFRVSNAKTIWGSCSAQNRINISWRLIMADDGVIEYIIVHELAHLLELNHSARFWAIIEHFIPDYKARRARLHSLQRELSYEDW